MKIQDRGNDLVQVLHRLYRELLIESDKQVRLLIQENETRRHAESRPSGAGGRGWILPPSTIGKCSIDMFERGIDHGAMGSAAAFLNRFIKKCGKSPWVVIAHTHECDSLRQGDEAIKHAHVCGFYAIRIEEGSPPTSPVKLNFPFVHATDPAWIHHLAVDISDMFEATRSRFFWNDAPEVVAP